MRIGIVCPVWFPVPPEAYGGTERVVALLADGLVEAGHDVTLFASGDSQTEALTGGYHTAFVVGALFAAVAGALAAGLLRSVSAPGHAMAESATAQAE